MQPEKHNNNNNIPVHHKINTQQCEYAALQHTGSESQLCYMSYTKVVNVNKCNAFLKNAF